MNADSSLEQRFHLCLELPNGMEATLLVPPGEFKRVLVALGERDYLRSRTVEMLLLILALEEE
jgi:hypothetical protein